MGLISVFFVRFRRTRGEERQQIECVTYAVALFTAVIVVVSVWPSLDASLAGSVLFLAGFLAIPSARALAILRHRLYDIDLIINRTLVYGILTLSLALNYFGGIVLARTTLRAVSGQESSLAVVASTLVIEALFNPMRRRIQGFIDRRFYRRKYDAAKTLEAFSARLREETDLDRLGGELVSVVRETMQPQHASLWLRPSPGGRGGRGNESNGVWGSVICSGPSTIPRVSRSLAAAHLSRLSRRRAPRPA